MIFLKRQNKKKIAQTTVEFCLGMMLVILIVYGLVMILKWSGANLIDNLKAHDSTLLKDISSDPNTGALLQVEPNFFSMRKMNAVYRGP